MKLLIVRGRLEMKRKVTNEEFEEAKKQWTPLIHKRTMAWSRMMDKTEAQQIAYIALWKSLQEFDNRSKFTTFLHRYLDWEYMNTMNAKKREMGKEITVWNFPDVYAKEEELKEPCQKIETLKKYLNPHQKEILSELMQGFKSVEIANRRKVSRQAISQTKVQIHQIAEDLVKRGHFSFS